MSTGGWAIRYTPRNLNLNVMARVEDAGAIGRTAQVISASAVKAVPPFSLKTLNADTRPNWAARSCGSTMGALVLRLPYRLPAPPAHCRGAYRAHARAGRGEGGSVRKSKTMFKILRPDEVWQPKLGAPFANRNALKTGLHTAEIKDLRRRIRAWHRRAAAAIEAAAEAIAKAAPQKATGPHDGDPVTTP